VIESKRKRLETKGWKIGSAREFLDLNDQEEAYIELRLKLADALKRQRISRNLTQEDLAKAMSSSQSRVAKMEADDASGSLDLLLYPNQIHGSRLIPDFRIEEISYGPKTDYGLLEGRTFLAWEIAPASRNHDPGRNARGT
jgi:transcriptional regulator with XRE-family HTH domain